ncbi:hypothetical protein NEAUS03_0203 [Nematocida ausubeli]|nr:hypothetical protein NEAUS03_0203 [Nematocida ausubeli]
MLNQISRDLLCKENSSGKSTKRKTTIKPSKNLKREKQIRIKDNQSEKRNSRNTLRYQQKYMSNAFMITSLSIIDYSPRYKMSTLWQISVNTDNSLSLRNILAGVVTKLQFFLLRKNSFRIANSIIKKHKLWLYIIFSEVNNIS